MRATLQGFSSLYTVLMLYFKGSTIFAKIRGVHSVQFSSFIEACKARDLMADDADWRRVISDLFMSLLCNLHMYLQQF